MSRYTIVIQGDTDDVDGVEKHVRIFADILREYGPVSSAEVRAERSLDVSRTPPGAAHAELVTFATTVAAVTAKREQEAKPVPPSPVLPPFTPDPVPTEPAEAETGLEIEAEDLKP